MGSRTKARARALQVLYAWETRGATESLRDVDRGLDPADRRSLDSEAQGYTNRILNTLEQKREQIDARIESLAENWRLSRMSTVDRNILRIAAAEMLYISDVPLRVSLHEAIRLAEWFGAEESRRFVNGVLDALLRQLEPDQLADSR